MQKEFCYSSYNHKDYVKIPNDLKKDFSVIDMHIKFDKEKFFSFINKKIKFNV